MDTRTRLAFAWTATMILVAFVDIFGFYRPDVREQIDAGRAFVFDIGEAFLFGVALYVTIPTLMIVLTVWLPRGALRVVTIAVAGLFALTIVGAAIGEWGYYLFVSAVELALLALIVTWVVRWRVPKPVPMVHPHMAR